MFKLIVVCFISSAVILVVAGYLFCKVFMFVLVVESNHFQFGPCFLFVGKLIFSILDDSNFISGGSTKLSRSDIVEI